MGLADVVRSGVALADTVTTDLQAAVTHKAWTGRDVDRKPTYAAGVSRLAIVERRQRLIRTATGEQILSRHRIAFLRPIAANGAATRREPIDPRDVLTLPDGDTGPILEVTGVVDPSTGAPYYAEVWLG